MPLTVCVCRTLGLTSAETDRARGEVAVHEWEKWEDAVTTRGVASCTFIVHEGNSYASLMLAYNYKML